MANENFDRWLQFNRLPDESLRDAIYRFSNTTKNPRAAKEYLVDEYRDQVNADDYNKKIQELPEIPSVDSQKAEMPDPETGEYDEYSLDDPFRRAGLQLKKTVGGSLSTLGFQDTGIEMSQEAEERLKQIARPPTREEIEKEGGFLGSVYGGLPEGFLGPGELVEGSLSSMAPYAVSLPAYMLGGPIAGVGAGYLASNLQVAGETHDRILDDPTVRRELDLPQGVAYSDMTPMQQTKLKDFAREVSRSAGLRRMYTAGLVELPSLFMPAFRVNKLIPEFIKRQALDITFGSASEVLDENLYAYNVANAFREKGMDEASADELQREIREMGPSNWEVFWSAFSQELTMGSVGTAAEVGASRIMGKNRDYRVDDTKTDQNELQNELARQQEELLPQYEKEAQEAQDKQDERDRKDREEQIKLDNARLDFAIKMDQLAQNREKADQDRIKAEEEELERLINIESGFQDEAQKNLGPRLAQLKARELYLKQVQRLRDQGYRMDEIFQDPETGEARLNVTPDLRYSTQEEAKPVEDTKAEPTLTELRQQEQQLSTSPTRTAEQNLELKEIQKQIKARDKRFLEEGPAERFDRLRREDISYSETSPEILDEIRDAMDVDPDSDIDQVIDAIDAENPKTLSAPVMRKVMDGIMSNFEKLKIKNIIFDTQNRNQILARKLETLRNQFPDVDDQALYDRARLDSTGVGAFVQNRADENDNQLLVLVPENIRGKTNEEVIRKAVQQIWHELFGHKALRDAYGGIDGQEYKDIINEFDKNNGRDVDDWLNTPGETGGAGYADADRFRQVEEFIARNFAEFGISKQGKFRKLISSMRKKLREMGFSTIREQDLIAIFEQLQDAYIPNNRSIISGEPLTQTRAVQPEQEEAPQAEEGEVSESRRPSDFDRFVSFGGKPPLRQFDKQKFDTRRAPKKTAQDAERYVDASILDSMKKKAWPEQLVKDLSDFDKYPKEFQDSFRKSLKSGLRKREQELANAVLAKGRQAYLQKKKGNVTPDTSATKGFEQGGAKWKELVDDVPKFARTTPEIQRAMRAQDISESKISDDPKARKMMVLPPKALPGGRVFQQWADRKMVDAEDAPTYRAGGRVIDVSDGMPASAKQPDMTGTTVPYAEIDTNFPGNRASFNVSGVDSQKKITKLPPGSRVTGNRISGGAVIEANLIGQGQAKFIDALPGVNTSTKNIATLQAGQIRKYNEEKDVQKTKKGNYSDHLFATKIVYDTDVELSTTGKDKPQPSVRPKTYGDIIVGNQVGTIKIGDRIAPLYDSLYVVAPGDDISFSYVGEKGFAEYNKRYSGSPSAKEFLEDLARQKKGQKGGRWFNPGLPDNKWRLEVPNTGTKLKSMPISFNGRDANWVVDFDASKFEGTRKPEGRRVTDNKKVRLTQSLPWLYLKDFVDIGVLADYYPELNTAYVHFAEDMQGEPLYYGTAIQLPDDNTGLSFILGVKPPDPEVIEFLDQSNMGASTRDWLEDIYMDKMNQAGHDGVPHRLIGSLLHEIQHYIQGVEGFEKGGNPEEMMRRLSEDRIKNSIRNNTKGVWVSISPNSRLRIQKRFAKVMEDRFGIDEAKKKIAAFGFKTPYRGTAWAKGNLFLDDDPFKTYERWGKKTRLNMMDMLTMPYQLSEALENKRNALFKDVTSGLAGAIGSLVREKAISKTDVAKLLKSVNELMVPFNLNVLGMASVDPLSTRIVGDDWSQMIAQSDYLRLAGEIEARDVEQRYIDMVRGNGRSGLPTIMNEKQKQILEKKQPALPFLQGGTERDITTIGKGNYTGSIPMNVPGEKPLGAPWDVNDMISYSASDPLADYSERFDITTRARIAQINNLKKGTPQRREAIRQLHLDLILHPIPFKDPTKGLPYQEELESSVPYEDLSWSQRLPGHELSGEQLADNYAKDPARWESVRTAKGGYEKSGAGGRGEGPIITGLGLKGKVSLKKKKGESNSDYKERLKKQADKDFKTLKTRAARLLYQGKIWTNWQKIRDMFGLNAGGRGRDAVPYLGHIIEFMKMQRSKLMNGEMTPRDIAKSVVMTLASQGADANNPWTVYNFTGGVKKAKAYKKNKYPASLKTFAEYMNAADWTDGEANIGQKELNGVLTEKAIVDYYNKAPLWVVNVPWNGEGPNGDMQYQQISDGVLFPKTVSWEEASKTPKYGTNGEPKDEMQYTGSKPQLVKVGKDWMLRIDGKDYSGMQHYMRAKRNEAFVKNIEDVKRPEIQKKIEKYENTIEEINANEKLDAEAKAKKIKKNQGFLDKNKKALADLDKKIEKDNKETEAVAKRMFAEMPLWFKNPGKEKAPSDKTGAVWVPQEYATTGGKPRMEDAVAYYFSTPDGQKVLDDIENGKFELKDWRKLANVRMAFGDDRLNQLLKPAQRKKNGEFEKAGLQDLTEYTEQFNEIVKNHIVDLDPKDLQGNDEMAVKLRLELAADLGNFAQKLYGIAEAKQAFFKHFLGLGDAPTIDAIELNTHIAGSPATDLVTSPLTGAPVANTWRVDLKWWSLKLQHDKLASIPELGLDATASGKTFFEHYRDTIKKAFDDIREDVDARDPNIFKDVPPDYFYHVMHHWLWDVGKALTRADAVMGESTERFRPAAYEAMWRDAAQQVLAYFRNDPIEATMVDWEPGHNQPDAVAEISEGDIELLEDISESVSLASMKGKLVQRSMSDRFATGFYVAKDQTSNIWPDTYQGKKGYWMRGGMGYPLMEDNIKARAAWAADDIKIVRNVRDLQAMGADHVITVVGAPDMHFSNKAYFSIFWRETQDMVNKDPKKKQALINRIDSIMLNPTNKNLLPVVKALKEAQSQNPGKDSWELLKMVGPTLTFGDRKPIVVALGGAFGIKKPTTPIVAFPNNTLWEDTTAFKEVAVGTPVGIIKLDPIGNQKMNQRAQDLGIPPHEAYEFVFKGEVIGSWIGQQGGIPFDDKQFRQLFKDYEKRIIKKFQYKPGTFDISAGSKYMFGKAKVPFKIPGAEIKKLEKNMDAPATPVSFSQMVNTLTTDSRHQADFNNAQLRQADWATSQSIFTRPLDQDVELPGGRKISDIVTRIVEPFGKVDKPEVLRDIRRRTRGRVLRVEEAGAKIYKALVKTKSPDLIYKYLTTKGGDASSIPDLKERAAAKEAKAAILEVGEALVDRGLLPPQALDKYGDGYLPKLYLQYLLDDNDRYAIQRGQSNKVSNMDYLKRRGYVDKSVADFVKGEVKDPAFLASKAMIQPGRDIALLDMFTEMVNTSQENDFNWVLPESVVEYDFVKAIARIAGDNPLGMELTDELARTEATRADLEDYIETLNQDIKKEREVLRAKDKMQSKELTAMVKERQMMRDKLKTLKPRKMSGYGLKAEADRIFKTIYPQVRAESKENGQIVADLVADMNRVADEAIGKVIIPSDYMQIPNNARYGKLRGMVVQKEIYDDLVGSLKMMKPENAAEAIIGESGFLGKASRFFKWSKVTANFPAAWVRNFSSNLVFMNIGGMNMAKIPYYLGAATGEMIKTWKGQRSIYDDVKDFGLTSSTFASVELGKIEKEYENFLNRTQRKGSPFRAFFLAKELLTTAQDWTSDKYGMVDSLGKTMMYMNGIDKGMTPQEAADHAEKWLFDYSLVKPSVKTIRNAIVGAPFITYATKVFPLLVETALTRPWRFAPYFALPYAMAAMFKETHDLDDEEYEGLMMSLQEYMREKRYAGNIMPLPYLDKFGRPQFLDLAYLYPWGMFTEIASEAQDDPTAIIQTLGLLGGPTASIISVLSTGVDPFTRRPVVNKLDSGEQKVEDALKYVYNLMMPPFLHTDYGALNRLRQTMDGELNRYGEPMKTIGQGISQTVGFNVSPVEPGTQRQRNARYMQSEILKTMGYAKRTLRDMKRMGKSNEEILEKNEYFKKLLKERKEKLKEYLKASKFPKEKLKQAN